MREQDFWNGTSDVLRRNPITGIAGCWARTVSGNPRAVPPSAEMNCRRPMLIVTDSARSGREALGNKHCYHALIAGWVKSAWPSRVQQIVRYEGYFCHAALWPSCRSLTHLRH